MRIGRADLSRMNGTSKQMFVLKSQGSLDRTYYLTGQARCRGQSRLKDPCTNAPVNARQGRRFAQTALKQCGSLEQRRDLATCPTFIPLNAELVACRTLRQLSLRCPKLSCV